MRTIIDMIDEAAVWLREQRHGSVGQPVAQPRGPGRPGAARDHRTASTWIAEAAMGPVATVTFRPDANRKLWNALETRRPAVYVSRLIVSRSAAGHGIGAA